MKYLRCFLNWSEICIKSTDQNKCEWKGHCRSGEEAEKAGHPSVERAASRSRAEEGRLRAPVVWCCRGLWAGGEKSGWEGRVGLWMRTDYE